MTMVDDHAKRILELLGNAGGLETTEADLAVGLGERDPALVLSVCERLMANGEIVRLGAGTKDDPYRYQLPDGSVPRL